jgi:hypothetical protein
MSNPSRDLKITLNSIAREHQLVVIRARLFGCGGCGQVWHGNRKRAEWQQSCHVAALSERAQAIAESHAKGLGEFDPVAWYSERDQP